MKVLHKINVVLEMITPILPIVLIFYISIIKSSLGGFIIALVLSILLFLEYEDSLKNNDAIVD